MTSYISKEFVRTSSGLNFNDSFILVDDEENVSSRLAREVLLVGTGEPSQSLQDRTLEVITEKLAHNKALTLMRSAGFLDAAKNSDRYSEYLQRSELTPLTYFSRSNYIKFIHTFEAYKQNLPIDTQDAIYKSIALNLIKNHFRVDVTQSSYVERLDFEGGLQLVNDYNAMQTNHVQLAETFIAKIESPLQKDHTLKDAIQFIIDRGFDFDRNADFKEVIKRLWNQISDVNLKREVYMHDILDGLEQKILNPEGVLRNDFARYRLIARELLAEMPVEMRQDGTAPNETTSNCMPWLCS